MQRNSPDRIHLLPGQLANQIAAGEVVERPASVVKELIENSLDAGAGRIDITVEEGGRRAILVQDDGGGIHVDDLQLALTRHATSKIRSFEDLVAIHSLGFRGEALPSIASVSRFALSSRFHDSEQAWRIEVDAQGKLSTLIPDPQPRGTRIAVEELFINTPARRRFLRSAKTEFVHIHDVVMRAALSRFDVAFSLTHNGRQVLRLPAATDAAAQQRRLATFCGQVFVEQARQVDVSRDAVRVHGWVMPAAQHRAQADRQFVFVNGRMMRDRVLLHAIRQAYGDSIPPGRAAMFALYLELDPSRVDVNVHPTKHEVRFRELRIIHDLLFSAVQQALQSGVLQAFNSAGSVATPRRDTGVREPRPAYSAGWQQTQANPARCHIETLLPGPFAVVHDDRSWLYDMQAVAERVFAVRRKTMRDTPRPLLIPQRCNTDAAGAQWLEEQAANLLQQGIELSRLDATTVLCRALASVYDGVDVERFVADILRTRGTTAAQLVSLAAAALTDPPSLHSLQALLDELEPGAHAACRRAVGAIELRRLYRALPS